MTSLEQNDAEVDAAAFNALRDALGIEDLSSLISECSHDLEEACAGLANARSNVERIKSIAHKIAGLLAQYACPQAARFAQRIAHEEDVDVVGLSAALALRTRLCAMQLRSLAGSL